MVSDFDSGQIGLFRKETMTKYRLEPIIEEGCQCADCRAGRYCYRLYRLPSTHWSAISFQSYASAEEAKNHYWGIAFEPDAVWEDGSPVEPDPTHLIMESHKQVGGFFRVMLREVQPEHVPDIIHNLWLFDHSGKKIEVPDGQWRMKMPHDYALVGEGPVGVAIEPPPGQVTRAGRPDPRLDEQDTQTIVGLCEQARRTPRPQRDEVIVQIFALDLDRCRPEALDAIDMLVYDLIVEDEA